MVSSCFGLKIASMIKRTLLYLTLATTTALTVAACGSETAEEASTITSSVVTEATTVDTSNAAPTTSVSSAAPSTEASTSAAPSSDAAEPAIPTDVITIDTDPEFAALVNTNDNCSQPLIDYAAANAGKTIQFDGYVANIAPSDTGGQRILVNPGVFDPAATPMGPSFQYVVPSAADMIITSGDASEITIGHGGTFTAKLGQFDSESCLLSLEPVSTVLN